MPDELPPSRRTILAAVSGVSVVGLGRSSSAAAQQLDASTSPAPAPSLPPAAVPSGAFMQAGRGATPRTMAAKMRDLVSVADYGARADGQTQELIAFTSAAESLFAGGPLDVTAGAHLVGSQTFGPARGNVHAYDTAVVGSHDIVADSKFASGRASTWSLDGFSTVSGGVRGGGGRPGSIRQSIVIESYTSYVVTIEAATEAAGGIAFFLGNRPIFTEGDASILPVGASTYRFTIFSYELSGKSDFQVRFDADWSGLVSAITLRKVEREAPYDFFGISHDKRDFSNVFGIKFGRFLSGNIAIGDRLTSGLLSDQASWNIAIGSRALSTNIDEIENTAVGAFVLEYNQASRNVAGGYSAFRYNTKGDRNTGWGYKVFGRNSVGSKNTGVGFWAGLYNQLGCNNSYLGSQAGYYNCNGSYNSAFGFQAGLQNDGGMANTYVGAISGPYTSGSRTFHFSHSTCVGAESKGYGDRTTAVGSQARCGSDPYEGGQAITTAATAVGHRATAIDDGTSAIGARTNALGVQSTCLGDEATTSGARGTAVGAAAQASTASTAVGAGAGRGLIGTGNISIGAGANGGNASRPYDNAIAIGFGAMCTASNQMVLGNQATRQIRAATAVLTTLSDGRDKTNVQYLDADHASRFVLSLKPARWTWKIRNDDAIGGEDVGFVAQDLLSSQRELAANWIDLVDTSDVNHLHAAPGRLLPVLVAALQDALRRIEQLENGNR